MPRPLRDRLAANPEQPIEIQAAGARRSGSKRSKVSMSATVCAAVAAAIDRHTTVVRPEERPDHLAQLPGRQPARR